MAKKPAYTQEFKEQAVRLSQEGSLTAEQVAKKLGIGVSTLTTWRRQVGVGEARKATSAALHQAQDEIASPSSRPIGSQPVTPPNVREYRQISPQDPIQPLR